MTTDAANQHPADEQPALTRPDGAPRQLPAPAPRRSPPGFLRQPSVIIAVLALALLGWQWLETREKLSNLQQELAKRLSQGDTVAQEGRTLAKQGQETLQTLQAKVGVLEARVADARSQQQALDNLYQELARNRDDRLTAEVEQTINIAAQQLQLAGNVQLALTALQSADGRLAGVNRPQFLVLRKAVSRDIERLRALPVADVPGMALKLETVIGAVDGIPLAFEAEPRSEAKAAQAADNTGGWWFSLGKELWGEMKQLVRIERLDRPDPGLLAPNNAFFLRENLKLRLVNARLSLLQRDGKSFREDARQARAWIDRYFDSRTLAAQAALLSLKQLGDTDINTELPTLNDSLAALRNLKVVSEKSGNR